KVRNTICEGLKTVAPGQSKKTQEKLYAICQNYCVHQKCDLNDRRGHKKHCIKLLDKWTNLANGLVIPCNASPGITLNKEVILAETSEEITTESVPQGTKIKYRFTVQNNGNVPLTNITLNDPDLNTLYNIANPVPCQIPSTISPGFTNLCLTDELDSLYRPDALLVVNHATITATPVAPYAQVPVTAEDTANYTGSPATAVCPCKDDWANFFGVPAPVNPYGPGICGNGGFPPNFHGYAWGQEGYVGIFNPAGQGFSCILRVEGNNIVLKGTLSVDEQTACKEDALQYCTPTP
ncbi:MAG: hypothetical protein EPN84_00150, partial [Legionella sp.]